MNDKKEALVRFIIILLIAIVVNMEIYFLYNINCNMEIQNQKMNELINEVKRLELQIASYMSKE